MENKDYWALHAVIIKKPYDLDKAKETVEEYIKDGKKHYYRETAKSYRFRNIPKTKFIKKSFRTKKINPNISLIFGKLKEEFDHLEGAGIGEIIEKPLKAIKEYFSPKKGYNKTSTKNLSLYGDLEINSLQIARTPIMKVIDKALNVLSFGKWDDLKKEYNYDKLFHLALIANLGNKNLVIEKNETININTSYKVSNDTEIMNVPLNGKKFTVNEMLKKTLDRIGPERFFLYDGFEYNCQVFVRDCLESEGLYGQREKDFLFQDLEELAKKVPSLTKKIMRLATDAGATVNKITGGKLPTAEERKKNEEEFWRQNELVRKRLNAKTNYENRGFMEERKKEKDEKKVYYKAFENALRQQGYKPESGQSYEEFVKETEQKTGYFPFPKKDDPLQWEWKKTKDVPLKLEDFGLAGKILQTVGLGDVSNSLLGIYNSSVELATKPNLKSAVNLGKSTVGAVKGSMDAYKAGPKGIAKETAKNLAKEAVGGAKMSLKDEFLMDTKDHQKKLSKYENEEHSIKEIMETLEGLKTITNNGLEHIKKLESMLELEGGSKASAFIGAIMAGKNKDPKFQKDFKKYNRDGFKEDKMKNVSSNVIRNKYDTKDYKEFILFFSYPTVNDLYDNVKMKEIYDEDPKLAKKANTQANRLYKKYIKDEVEDDYKYMDENEKNSLFKEWVMSGETAEIFKKLYNIEPIKNILTPEMKANINKSIKKYRDKMKAEKIIEKVKKGQEVELIAPNVEKRKKK